jgi:hypothetical protein
VGGRDFMRVIYSPQEYSTLFDALQRTPTLFTLVERVRLVGDFCFALGTPLLGDVPVKGTLHVRLLAIVKQMRSHFPQRESGFQEYSYCLT